MFTVTYQPQPVAVRRAADRTYSVPSHVFVLGSRNIELLPSHSDPPYLTSITYSLFQGRLPNHIHY